VRAGNDNLFQSKIFSATIANLLGCRIEIMATTGAVGAAIAAGAGIGYWSDVREGLSALRCLEVFEPEKDRDMYREAYEHWAEHLEKTISQ
ncbi:MAG: carbohydrate kinase, partial [Saprospiraceae bacterium]|nr:carbohydrate kinase [Saprospiraceae bacterium]